MAIAYVGATVGTRAGGVNSASVTRNGVSAGNLLVAHAAVFNSGGSGEPTWSDTVNGTWTGYSSTGYFASGDADSEIYLVSFPNSGAGDVQFTCNPPGTAADIDLALVEVSGAATSSPRDVSVTATGTFNTGNPATTAVATGTLAQANEIVFSSFSHTAGNRGLTNDTADSFTQVAENESNSGGQTYHLQYKIVAATTSLTVNGDIASGTGAGTWFTGVASFKEASAVAAEKLPSGLRRPVAMMRAAYF